MRAIIPTKSITLKELLSSGEYHAKLFTNDIGACEDIPSDFQFEEPIFNGYSSKLLNSDLWKLFPNDNYSQFDYQESLIWGNSNIDPSETIYGYFITDSKGSVLWFGKFDNSVEIKQNQNIVVDIRVYLNNYEYPKNTITIVVKGDTDKPQNTNIFIEDIRWGGISYPYVLIDLMDSDWTPNQNVLCIGVDDIINICKENPLSFNITVTAVDYGEYKENIIIEDIGSKFIEINLVKPTTTTVAPSSWSSSSPYLAGDIVRYGGNFYVAIINFDTQCPLGYVPSNWHCCPDGISAADGTDNCSGVNGPQYSTSFDPISFSSGWSQL